MLVTGATSGIGRHASLHLARRGHRVIATGRSADALSTLRQEAGDLALTTVRLDVTDTRSIYEAAAEVDRLTEGRGIDVLVNNAGYGLLAPVAEVRIDDVRAQLETNVLGLLAVTQVFLPKMISRGRGRIINISSVVGRTSFPFYGAYSASKHAVEALSDALRMELAPLGINVVLVEPGPIRTEFVERAMGTLSPYRKPGSIYASVLARAEKLREKADAYSVGPERTSRVIERAAVSRRPCARYVVPRRVYLVLALYALLPTRLMDAILAWAMGLRVLAK